MKKNLYVLFILPLLAGFVYAQNEPIPDGHFEYWDDTHTTYGGDVYYELADPFWESLNLIATLPPDMFTGPVTMFREAGRSGTDGDYCPMLKSNEMDFGTNPPKHIFLPGALGCLHVLVDEQTAVFGRPFTSRPKAIKGWMKYAPVNGDSASIFVEVYRWNETLGRRVLIGRVEQHYLNPVDDWTEFNLELAYNNDQTPDSISVLFVSSAGYNFDDLFECQGQVGSTLWVDDVAFVYEGEDPGTDPQANEKSSVLAASTLNPNPSASGIFKVNVPEACRADVVSLSGKVLLSRDMRAGNNLLDLSAAAKGIYMVRLSNARGVAVLKAVRP